MLLIYFLLLSIIFTILFIYLLTNYGIIKFVKYFDLSDIADLIFSFLAGATLAILTVIINYCIVVEIYDVKPNNELKEIILLENPSIIISDGSVYYKTCAKEKLETCPLVTSKFLPYSENSLIKVYNAYIDSPFWNTVLGGYWGYYYEFYIPEENMP